MSIVYMAAQLVAVLLLAPLVNGIIQKIKALTQKRQGAPLWQSYLDCWKLFKKNSVVSETSSWLFRAAPYVVFATAALASLFVPLTMTLYSGSLFGGTVAFDALVFVSLLALGRFFMMCAALDTGSTFGGMGSSREAMISALIEPSILVALFTVGLITKTTAIPGMMGAMTSLGVPLAHPVFLLLFLALLIIIIAETARIPVDDPATHLELTMVHEAMELEYSGRQLGLVKYGASVKQLSYILLLSNLLLPTDQWALSVGTAGTAGVLLALLFSIVKVTVIAVVLGLIEVSTVKLKLFSIPNLAALAFILSLLGFIQYFVLGGSHV